MQAVGRTAPRAVWGTDRQAAPLRPLTGRLYSRSLTHVAAKRTKKTPLLDYGSVVRDVASSHRAGGSGRAACMYVQLGAHAGWLCTCRCACARSQRPRVGLLWLCWCACTCSWQARVDCLFAWGVHAHAAGRQLWSSCACTGMHAHAVSGLQCAAPCACSHAIVRTAMLGMFDTSAKRACMHACLQAYAHFLHTCTDHAQASPIDDIVDAINARFGKGTITRLEGTSFSAVPVAPPFAPCSRAVARQLRLAFAQAVAEGAQAAGTKMPKLGQQMPKLRPVNATAAAGQRQPEHARQVLPSD
eukprot:364836-Chlamydomonas_euryale.AAC.10